MESVTIIKELLDVLHKSKDEKMWQIFTSAAVWGKKRLFTLDEKLDQVNLALQSPNSDVGLLGAQKRLLEEKNLIKTVFQQGIDDFLAVEQNPFMQLQMLRSVRNSAWIRVSRSILLQISRINSKLALDFVDLVAEGGDSLNLREETEKVQKLFNAAQNYEEALTAVRQLLLCVSGSINAPQLFTEAIQANQAVQSADRVSDADYLHFLKIQLMLFNCPKLIVQAPKTILELLQKNIQEIAKRQGVYVNVTTEENSTEEEENENENCDRENQLLWLHQQSLTALFIQNNPSPDELSSFFFNTALRCGHRRCNAVLCSKLENFLNGVSKDHQEQYLTVFQQIADDFTCGATPRRSGPLPAVFGAFFASKVSKQCKDNIFEKIMAKDDHCAHRLQVLRVLADAGHLNNEQLLQVFLYILKQLQIESYTTRSAGFLCLAAVLRRLSTSHARDDFSLLSLPDNVAASLLDALSSTSGSVLAAAEFLSFLHPKQIKVEHVLEKRIQDILLQEGLNPHLELAVTRALTAFWGIGPQSCAATLESHILTHQKEFLLRIQMRPFSGFVQGRGHSILEETPVHFKNFAGHEALLQRIAEVGPKAFQDVQTIRSKLGSKM